MSINSIFRSEFRSNTTRDVGSKFLKGPFWEWKKRSTVVKTFPLPSETLFTSVETFPLPSEELFTSAETLALPSKGLFNSVETFPLPSETLFTSVEPI